MADGDRIDKEKIRRNNVNPFCTHTSYGTLCLVSIIFLLKRWKWGVTVFLFAIVTNYVTEKFPLNITKLAGKVDFRVMTYNMHYGGNAFNPADNPNRLFDLIFPIDGDIIVLQEYSDGGTKVFRERLKEVYPYFALMDSNCKNAIFSKYPIIDNRRDSTSYVQYALLDIKGQKMLIVNCHLESNNYESRSTFANDR